MAKLALPLSSDENMDKARIDEIAKSLQSLYLRKLAAKRPVTTPDKPHEANFIRDLFNNVQLVRSYQDWDLQEKARSVVPIDRLHQEAEALQAQESGSLLNFQDFVMKRMLVWFKTEFFKWVNEAPCSKCQGKTVGKGAARPTQFESAHGAGHVELYHCNTCNLDTRFPRYNDPSILLDERRGRCGEWANTFTLICVAMGYEARYVRDWTDHVWTEYYSDSLKRWVHLDSCEAAFDTPLVYEVGWGKKLNYCISFSRNYAVDVTKRYTRDLQQLLPRRNMFSEKRLLELLAKVNALAWKDLNSADIAEIVRELAVEKEELERSRAAPVDLPGRISGSVEWRSQRGEIGTSSASLPKLDIAGLRPQLAQAFADQFSMKGSASKASANKLILTPEKTDIVGATWFKEAQNLSKLVVLEFGFCINRSGTGSGADGCALVFQSDPAGPQALGTGGCELGYGGLHNAYFFYLQKSNTFSVAIEFDTYASVDRCSDPDDNHISVHVSNGDKPVSAHYNSSIKCVSSKHGLPRFVNGTEYFCVVVLDIAAGTLQLWLTDSKASQSSTQLVGANYVRLFEVAHDFKSTLKQQFHVGFTAATGGLCQQHEITHFQIFER